MSLVKCNECSKDVSDKAVACPACGNPLVVKAPQSIVAPTIELTNKKWKKMTILGLVLFFIGFMLVFKSPGLGVFFMFAAFVIAIVTRIGAWWTNG